MVPPLVLDVNTKYYWHTRFSNGECWSDFSDVFSFTTTDLGAIYINGVAAEDIIANGDVKLADFKEKNGGPVNTDTTKVFQSKNSPDCQIGLVAVNATIEKCGSRDPQDFDGETNTDDVPNFECGLIELELKVDNPGEVASVTYYYTQTVPDDFTWWKYDPNIGFYDYEASTDNPVVSVSEDRRSVTVRFKDGGYGDLIGTPDGKIIDPAGAGGKSSVSSSSSGSGGGSCFITSAGSGGTTFVMAMIWILLVTGVCYTAVAERRNY